jgi:hypothetical protein
MVSSVSGFIFRETYTTPGIYIKTGFFALHDQVKDSPPAWGDGFSGFAKRVASNQATNIIQNACRHSLLLRGSCSTPYTGYFEAA